MKKQTNKKTPLQTPKQLNRKPHKFSPKQPIRGLYNCQHLRKKPQL